MVRLSRRHFLQVAGAAAAAPAVDLAFHSFAGVAHVFDSQPGLAQACGQIANVCIDRHVLNVRPTQTA
jgi:hypothetical protein